MRNLAAGPLYRGATASLFMNGGTVRETALDSGLRRELGAAGRALVDCYLAACFVHRATPLLSLPALAKWLGISSLHVKDEGGRLGLGSFKALGGAYAVIRLVLETAGSRNGRAYAESDLMHPDVRAVARTLTVACATDGNHGCSVVAGARLMGCAAVIFVHPRVSKSRVDTMIELGGRVEVVPGTYDDCVEAAITVSARNGWIVVSDTSWPGYERIPLLVMQGYTVAAGEALDRLDQPPTHVFLQAGVGGFAAAVAVHLAGRMPFSESSIVVVEPDHAACVKVAAAAGKSVRVRHEEPTSMAMLECYQASPVALRILCHLADAFMAIPDKQAAAAMGRLTDPLPGDPEIVSGPSGAAGLAGLLAAAADDACRERLALNRESRVLIFNTEGAVDLNQHRRLIEARGALSCDAAT